jgi:hypothetical protein
VHGREMHKMSGVVRVVIQGRTCGCSEVMMRAGVVLRMEWHGVGCIALAIAWQWHWHCSEERRLLSLSAAEIQSSNHQGVTWEPQMSTVAPFMEVVEVVTPSREMSPILRDLHDG